jgi:hypothetical protein
MTAFLQFVKNLFFGTFFLHLSISVYPSAILVDKYVYPLQWGVHTIMFLVVASGISFLIALSYLAPLFTRAREGREQNG